MSVINQQVYAAPGVLFSSISGGGGGGGSYPQNPTFSSITFNGGGGASDISFPPGYTADFNVDTISFQATSGGNNITLDAKGIGINGLYPIGDAAIVFPNDSFFSEDGGGNLSIKPGTSPGAYVAIDTCIPDCYRVQLTDNTQPPGAAGTTAQIYASPTSVFIGDAQQSSFALSVSSLNVSSINGAAPGGGGSVPGNLVVSSITLAGDPTAIGAQLELVATDGDLYEIAAISSATFLASLKVGQVGGRNQVYADILEAPNFYASTITGTTGVISLNPTGTDQIRLGGLGAPGDISVASVGGGNFNVVAGNMSTNVNNVNQTATTATHTINAIGSAPNISMRAETGAATIWSAGGGLRLSTISLLNSGTPLVSNPTPFGTLNSVQVGYSQDTPNASTILFNYPYDTENIAVMLTPTNRNTSGGANPNLSLNNSFGLSGTGVSSIGFQVDARDGGVGYQGSFMWMAIPRNLV
jgi:hypothetical protein